MADSITSCKWCSVRPNIHPRHVLVCVHARSRRTCGKIRRVLLILENVPLIKTRTRHLLLYYTVAFMAETPIRGCRSDKEAVLISRVRLGDTAREEQFSYLPPRMGSAPWAAKSRPYKLSPSRIFCLHWAVGASWRMQSLTQGRGELGPGLSKPHINKGERHHWCCRSPKDSFTSLWLTLHRWNNRTSSGWIRRPRGPTLRTPPGRTYQAAPN